jgi:opacity protein-like surface antigen
MKTTKKIVAIAFLTVASLISLQLKAQDMTTTSTSTSTGMDLKIGIGASASITDGNSPFSYGIGADVRVTWKLAPAVAITASGGYTRLVARDNSLVPAYSYIPAVGGVKIYPISGMYLNGFAGAGFAVKDGSKTSFLFGGGTGYEWENGLELGVRYEGNQQNSASVTYQSIVSQYALRVGYNF